MTRTGYFPAAAPWNDGDDRVATAGQLAGEVSSLQVRRQLPGKVDPRRVFVLLCLAVAGSAVAAVGGGATAVDSAVGGLPASAALLALATPTARAARAARELGAAPAAASVAAAGAAPGAPFSPDGRRVVTVDYDGVARVWEARSGKTLAVLRAETGSIDTAVFSPDGSRVVTGSSDGRPRPGMREAGGASSFCAVTPARSTAPSSALTPRASSPPARTERRGSGTRAPAEGLFVLGTDFDLVDTAVFSRDGTLILTVASDESEYGTAEVWDARTRKELYCPGKAHWLRRLQP